MPPRVGEELQLADPERALSVAYAPAAVRPALTALFALDERLGAIVAATTEPTIGLIRLAWWREALERLDGAPPPAEPLLAALAARCLPLGISGAALAEIEDGWAALLDSEPKTAAIDRHGRARGGGLFAAAAHLLSPSRGPGPALGRTPTTDGMSTPEDVRGNALPAIAGTAWALADLGHRHSDAETRSAARLQAQAASMLLPRDPWPRPLRPLGALAVLARRDAAAETRAQGSPRRLLRMLALRLTGL